MGSLDLQYKRAYEKVFKELLSASPSGYYDESALPSYTHGNPLMSWLFWRRINVALGLAHGIRGKSVLDFGCGGGVTFKYFKDLGCDISGCDNASCEVAEDICRQFGITAKLYRELDQVRDKKFDFIFALDVLEHIEDLRPILNRFKELSHGGTRVILSGPTENLLYKLGRQLAGFSGHYHVRNIYDIEGVLKTQGFKQMGVKSLYFPATLFRVSSWSVE